MYASHHQQQPESRADKVYPGGDPVFLAPQLNLEELQIMTTKLNMQKTTVKNRIAKPHMQGAGSKAVCFTRLTPIPACFIRLLLIRKTYHHDVHDGTN